MLNAERLPTRSPGLPVISGGTAAPRESLLAGGDATEIGRIVHKYVPAGCFTKVLVRNSSLNLASFSRTRWHNQSPPASSCVPATRPQYRSREPPTAAIPGTGGRIPQPEPAAATPTHESRRCPRSRVAYLQTGNGHPSPGETPSHKLPPRSARTAAPYNASRRLHGRSDNRPPDDPAPADWPPPHREYLRNPEAAAHPRRQWAAVSGGRRG